MLCCGYEQAGLINNVKCIKMTALNLDIFSIKLYHFYPCAITILNTDLVSDIKQMSCDMTKPTKWMCAQRRLRPVGSESSLSTWRKLRSLATHWAHSEDSDQSGRMPRLIWVFAGRTVTLFVLSCRSSNCNTRPRSCIHYVEISVIGRNRRHIGNSFRVLLLLPKWLRILFL